MIDEGQPTDRNESALQAGHTETDGKNPACQ
jgi:hypothetical protein